MVFQGQLAVKCYNKNTIIMLSTTKYLLYDTIINMRNDCYVIVSVSCCAMLLYSYILI